MNYQNGLCNRFGRTVTTWILFNPIFSNLLQDLEGCLTLEEITDKFSLYKLCCGRSWHIQACDAPNGTGLTDGLDWLSRQLVASGVHDLG